MEWVLVPREQLDGLVTKIGAAAHVQSPLLPEYVAMLKREARAMLAAAPQAEPVAEVGDLVLSVRERLMAVGLKNRDPLYTPPGESK